MSEKTDRSDREEQAILKTRGKFVPELLKWVTSGEQEITQDLNAAIDRVMKDRRRRVEVFLTALARKYVERAVYFIGRLPEIEEELLNPERIATMRNADLIRLLGVVAEQVQDASDFLRNFVSDEVLRSEPVPSPGAEFTPKEPPKEVEATAVSDDEVKAAAALPTESRQRIGGILRKVLMAVDAADSNVQGKQPLALSIPKPAPVVDGEAAKGPKEKPPKGAGK